MGDLSLTDVDYAETGYTKRVLNQKEGAVVDDGRASEIL